MKRSSFIASFRGSSPLALLLLLLLSFCDLLRVAALDVPSCDSDNVTVSQTVLDSPVKELQWVGSGYSTVAVVTQLGRLCKPKGKRKRTFFFFFQGWNPYNRDQI